MGAHQRDQLMANSKELSKEIQAKYRETGRFVANFNELDTYLDQIIDILANKDNVAVGEIIGAAIQSFVVKCNIIVALVHFRGSGDLNDGYGNLAQRLRELNEVRIDLVHGEHWLDIFGKRYRRTLPAPMHFMAR